MSGQPSTGEWAGIAAAVVLVLTAIGRGGSWLLGWADTRGDAARTSRERKLQAWQDELDARDERFDRKMEERFTTLESENVRRVEESNALRLAFELVASALRAIDPRNTALSRAEQLLQAAFPLAPIIPGEMAATLSGVEARTKAADAAARVKGETA